MYVRIKLIPIPNSNIIICSLFKDFTKEDRELNYLKPYLYQLAMLFSRCKPWQLIIMYLSFLYVRLFY